MRKKEAEVTGKPSAATAAPVTGPAEYGRKKVPYMYSTDNYNIITGGAKQ